MGRMGEERAVGKAAAGAAGIVRDGENEEIGVRTNATKKRTAVARYKSQKLKYIRNQTLLIILTNFLKIHIFLYF